MAENELSKAKQAVNVSETSQVLVNVPINNAADTADNIPNCNATNAPDAHICKGCLKWDSYQDKCWVYWKGKRECSLRVQNADEWQDEHKFRQW